MGWDQEHRLRCGMLKRDVYFLGSGEEKEETNFEVEGKEIDFTSSV